MDTSAEPHIEPPCNAEACLCAAALIDGAAAIIRGKRDFLQVFVAGLLAGGHILLEDNPGLGKTSLAKTIARLIGGMDGATAAGGGVVAADGGVGAGGCGPAAADGGLLFKRIQFTPDLLPYDITGVDVFDPQSQKFRFAPGPVMANIVLADEINRATPKVQSALLEVMAERQVTVGQMSYTLPEPFVVLATQNTIESEGTFPLPAAQLDRFMMRLSIGYPDREAEISVLNDNPGDRLLAGLKPVISVPDFLAAQNACAAVFCHDALKAAITDIARETRSHKAVSLGASPRAGLHLLAAVKAFAWITGRAFVTDEDIAALAPSVLAHRLKLKDAHTRSPTDAARTLIEEISRNVTGKVRGNTG